MAERSFRFFTPGPEAEMNAVPYIDTGGKNLLTIIDELQEQHQGKNLIVFPLPNSSVRSIRPLDEQVNTFRRQQQGYFEAFSAVISILGRKVEISPNDETYVIFPNEDPDSSFQFGFTYNKNTYRVGLIKNERIPEEDPITVTVGNTILELRNRISVIDLPSLGPLSITRLGETKNGKLIQLDEIVDVESNPAARAAILGELETFHRVLFPAHNPGRKVNSF